MSGKKAMGIIFTNTNDELLGQLTSSRATASVPFCGRYRMIDFMLSSFARSGIYQIGVITRKNYYSLMDHIGSGREWDLSRKSAGIHILPPYSHEDLGVYSGKIQALGNVIEFIESYNANYVVLADSDIIINTNLKGLLASHAESGADITILYKKCVADFHRSSNCTVLSMDENGRVADLFLNPRISGELDISLNIMVMGKRFLEELIKDSISNGRYGLAQILQRGVKDYKIMGKEYKGEAKIIHSIKDYYDANISLLDPDNMERLFTTDKPVYTKVYDEVPAKYGLDSYVKNSLIADGCIIEGRVENSVLFRGVHVKEGAIVRNSVIMQDTVVGENSSVNYAITDRDVEIKDYRVLSGTSDYPVFVPKKTSV